MKKWLILAAIALVAMPLIFVNRGDAEPVDPMESIPACRQSVMDSNFKDGVIIDRGLEVACAEALEKL